MTYRELPSPSCPVCRVELEPPEDAFRCASCGGIWTTRQWLMQRMRDQGRTTELEEFPDGRERRPCAVCGEPMDIVWLELLALDECPEHGVWLDAGELERALAGHTMPRTTGARVT